MAAKTHSMLLESISRSQMTTWRHKTIKRLAMLFLVLACSLSPFLSATKVPTIYVHWICKSLLPVHSLPATAKLNKVVRRYNTCDSKILFTDDAQPPQDIPCHDQASRAKIKQRPKTQKLEKQRRTVASTTNRCRTVSTTHL